MKLTTQTPRNNSLVNWFFDDAHIRDAFHNPVHARKDSQLPKTNILENKNGFIIELATPGFSKEELSLDIEANKLKISGKKEVAETENNFRMKEFGSADFERVFKLSENTDLNMINAEYSQGILRVTLPTKEIERKSLDINVK